MFTHAAPLGAAHGARRVGSPAIHPLNRNRPGGAHGENNPCPATDEGEMLAKGTWPALLALGLWFPSTDKLTTKLVRHGDVWDD